MMQSREQNVNLNEGVISNLVEICHPFVRSKTNYNQDGTTQSCSDSNVAKKKKKKKVMMKKQQVERGTRALKCALGSMCMQVCDVHSR